MATKHQGRVPGARALTDGTVSVIRAFCVIAACACGEDSTPPFDSGVDAGSDASADAQPDGSGDGSVDASSDAGFDSDLPADGSAGDASSDATLDAGIDGSSDGGLADATSDGAADGANDGSAGGDGGTTACNPTGTPFGGGSGTMVAPFQICSASQLDAVRGQPGASFELAADVELLSFPFAPIATFTGDLDGRGHEIRNWTLNNPGGSDFALVQALSGGTIRNLVLRNVTISGSSSIAGLVITMSSGASISNVQVSGSLTAANGSVGGVVSTLSTGSTIDGALFDGMISSSAGQFHGGVVRNIASGATVQNVLARGTMVLAGTAQKAGGIASDVNGVLRNCRSAMDVVSAANSRIGGIAAVLGGGAAVSDCYATSALTFGSAPVLSGGLFGEEFGSGARSVSRTFFAGTFPMMGADPIIGSASIATYADVFWDSTSSGQGSSTATGPEAKTTAELQMMSTFTNYASPPWSFPAGAYPSLVFESGF